jgi:hypothetical protein
MPFLNSTALTQVEYNAGTRQLYIWFAKGNGPYTYYGVPEQIYVGLIRAPSPGEYYNTYIKDRFS